MSLTADPLSSAERTIIAEELASVLRHDLRNKIASVANAMVYIRRRLEKTSLWQEDPRLAPLCAVLDSELRAMNDMIGERLGSAEPHARRVARFGARACLERAVALARIGPQTVGIEATDAALDGDPDELALAIRCLIENAAEPVADGQDRAVRISGHAQGSMYVIDVGCDAPASANSEQATVVPALDSRPPGRAGTRLSIARRVALQQGGRLEVAAPEDQRGSVRLILRIGGEGDDGTPASGR